MATQAAGAAPANHMRRVLTLWVVLSILGVAATALGLPRILPPTGSDSEAFANLTIVVFTVISVPVALFVWVFIGYSLSTFRVDDNDTGDGPAMQPSRLMQVGWLGITGLLCLFLLVWGLYGIYEQTAVAASSPLTVRVVGQQWTWNYTYPQYGISSHTLELPLHRQVQFKVTSKDVLHGFEITPLGVRIDANPQQVVTTPLVTPTRLGPYKARCVELCGLYHSFMFTDVKVVSAPAFDAWIKSHGGHL